MVEIGTSSEDLPAGELELEETRSEMAGGAPELSYGDPASAREFLYNGILGMGALPRKLSPDILVEYSMRNKTLTRTRGNISPSPPGRQKC